MAEVEIYTTPICPYCVRAKALLSKKGVSYKEIDVGNDAELREAMIRRASGKRTVPQIFINGRHVGGSDDLYALERKGELDGMLALTPQ
jgi:glutaredoxin 3